MVDEIKIEGREDWTIAIESLEKTKQDMLKKIAKLDVLIANLKNNPPERRASILQGSYKGMSISQAAQTFLLTVSPGKAIYFDVLMQGLTRGGVRLGDPEKPNRYAANVKATIASNRHRFRYDKRRNTVRLIIEKQESAAAG